MHKIYTGIGSRKTPTEVLKAMMDLASELYGKGWILRSGGANGADSAFEMGTGPIKEIYLPWKNFNKNESILCPPKPEAYNIALLYHPAFKFLKPPVKALHARNVHQILGWDLKTPTSLVICWTPDGCEDGSKTTKDTGGTGQAIRIASAFDIPIFNLKNKGSLDRLVEFISQT